jgi:hypothetical protein
MSVVAFARVEIHMIERISIVPACRGKDRPYG